MTPPSRPTLAAALAIAVVAISSAALWIRLSHASALAISFHRLAYASVILAAPGWRALRRELPSLPVRARWAIPAAGAALALHFAAWIASMAPSSPYATSTAASTTLVVTHPAMVVLAERALHGTRVSALKAAGIGLSLAGAAVIAAGDLGSGHRVTGDLLALLGAAAGAGYFMLGAGLRSRLGLMAYVFPVYATAAAGLWGAAMALGLPLHTPSLREHGLFLATALGPMLLGHTTLNWALRWLPAWLVSATILAEPPVSVAMVFLATGERPPASAWLGGALVLGGLAVLTRSAAPKESEP